MGIFGGLLWALRAPDDITLENYMIHTSNIPVRFSDIDVMGHVNNAVYLNYFEQARMQFFEDSIGSDWDWKKDGIVLARNEVDYMHPILLDDKVLIDTRIDSMGNKSLTISYEVYKTKGNGRTVHARGKSVIVCYDYESRTTTDVPTLWREKFSKP